MDKTLTQVTDYLQSLAHQGNGNKVVKFVIDGQEYDFVGLVEFHCPSDPAPIKLKLEKSL